MSVTAKDLIPEKDTVWLVRNLIKRNDSILLLGQPHRGKSWLIYQLAICAALGKNFLQDEKLPTTECSVLLINEDCPTETVMQRLQRIAAYYGALLKDLPIKIHSMNGTCLDNSKGIKLVLSEIESMQSPVLLLVDCLENIFPTWNLNYSVSGAKIFQVYQQLRAGNNTTILSAHHTSMKNKLSDTELFYDDKTDWTKACLGSTKLISICETALGMFDNSLPGKQILGLRMRSRRHELDIPIRLQMILEEDGAKSLEFEDEIKSAISLKSIGEPHSLPTWEACLLAPLFLEDESVLTIKQTEEKMQGLLSVFQIRDAYRELELNKVVFKGSEAHNRYKYLRHPHIDWSSSYVQGLLDGKAIQHANY